MPNPSTKPRILFVTPEVVFVPEGTGNRAYCIGACSGCFGDFLAEFIHDLLKLGVDVHVAQPDYRDLFKTLSHNKLANPSIKLPSDRVHLAEDRAFYYSKPINSNYEWENIEISLDFQREVINQIAPRVQPDLIHCHDWMTGLIPAAAKEYEMPCLFTVHNSDSAKSLLSDVEDRGIDAAAFWRYLFYDRFPGGYEDTRDSNPLDLLLSGILAAHQVDTASFQLLLNIAKDRSTIFYSCLRQVLAGKFNAGQKLWFWLSTAGGFVMAYTGYVIWAFQGTVDNLRLMAIIHNFLGAALTAVFIVHLYMSLFAIKGKRFGYHRHCQSSQIFANFSNDRSRSGTGTTAESGRDEYHVTVRQSVSDFFFIFKGRIPADLGICPGPEAFGHTFAQLDPNRRLGYFKGLGVCIGRNELDALEIGCDHVVYGISPCTPDTNDFDFRRIFIFNIGKHFLPSYRFELWLSIYFLFVYVLFKQHRETTSSCGS